MKQILSVFLFSCLLISAQSQDNRINLLFAGDAMQHMPQVYAAWNGKDYNYDNCFHLIKDKIQQADIACVNFETTLGGMPYRGYPLFSSPDAFARSLKQTGFDLFFLANNHMLDRGKPGLERTINQLNSFDIKHTGVFKNSSERKLNYPVVLTVKGIRIAFLNYTTTTNGLHPSYPNIINLADTLEIKKDLINTHLLQPDIIIANMHWGEEYFTRPTKHQKTLADFLLRNGVRIIIGHHPHVVQPMIKEIKNNKIDKVTYYSLGNFISNQRQLHTDGGAFAEITLKIMKDNSIEIESARHALFWVRKHNIDQQLSYTIIPADVDPATINPSLTPEETQKMSIFVSNAKKKITAQ